MSNQRSHLRFGRLFGSLFQSGHPRFFCFERGLQGKCVGQEEQGGLVRKPRGPRSGREGTKVSLGRVSHPPNCIMGVPPASTRIQQQATPQHKRSIDQNNLRVPKPSQARSGAKRGPLAPPRVRMTRGSGAFSWRPASAAGPRRLCRVGARGVRGSGSEWSDRFLRAMGRPAESHKTPRRDCCAVDRRGGGVIARGCWSWAAESCWRRSRWTIRPSLGYARIGYSKQQAQEATESAHGRGASEAQASKGIKAILLPTIHRSIVSETF